MGIELYVGVDDSNHAGTVRGEIVLATFSRVHEDSIVRNFNEVRNQELALKWMESPERDYRFSILFGENWRRSSTNLVYAAPILIDAYLQENQLPDLETIKVYLDGPLSSGGRERLRKELEYIPKQVIDNFTKIKHYKLGKQKCPTVVYMADFWAHHTFRQGIENGLTSKKYVPMIEL